jgi:hypothetical protein
MQGATTQAMRRHRRGAATQQMPAAAPLGLRLSGTLASLLAPYMHTSMLVARA